MAEVISITKVPTAGDGGLLAWQSATLAPLGALLVLGGVALVAGRGFMRNDAG
ncbi:MAG TPA: hypothetical protein VI876_04660 [Dehalococcoidia bacterium]|nr:hypothetical protein [Dehalococcoidia bacterium]